ncbi:MAG: TIGR01777 family oxidoreductase [Nocardioides sp.]|uniref:TIGR01777 family oxidoreductase n=1 Tax=Nocardioides sp. TaxID=35761 RepID=UPI0039E52B32
MQVHQRSTHVEVPFAEVAEWHRRPGALSRLLPPWQPVRVLAETADLRGGRAVLGLPGGVRWLADHDPAAYAESSQMLTFVDRATTWPRWVHWVHRHALTATPDGTRVLDTVETNLPGRLVRPTLRYRATELADDLAAHARPYADRRLTVALTGSSGLVGSALTPFLTGGGHRVIRLVRRSPRGADERYWDPAEPAADLFDGVDVVVHLAGVSIAGRFTAAHKEAIRDSRIGPTAALARLAATSGLTGFVSASAVGIYGADRGDEELTEKSERGQGLLADVVADWEAATEPATRAGLRTVQVRTGIVLSPRGGVLRLQRPLFALGVGGPLGSGWLPWIGIDDLVDVYHRAILDQTLTGPVNAVAPYPVRGTEYARALGRSMHRPAVLAVPSIGPRLLLGEEGARELALSSQRVRPTALEAAGHPFRSPDLDQTFGHLLGTAR